MLITFLTHFVLGFSYVVFGTPMVNLFIEQMGVPRLVSSKTNNLEEPLYLDQPFDETKYNLDTSTGCTPIK